MKAKNKEEKYMQAIFFLMLTIYVYKKIRRMDKDK